MRIFHIDAGHFTELDALPGQLPAAGFLWIGCAQHEFEVHLPELQRRLQTWAGAGLVDGNRTLVPRLPEDPLAEGGRGLYLVARLALDVAVAARATGGTVVSVTLDLQRAS